MNQSFLHNAHKQFLSYKNLGELTISKLSDEQLHLEINKGVNSIVIIIQHLSGNMLSRFTDFLTTDGEKPWRMRDKEFETNQYSRKDLMEIWNSGWDCLLNTINNLNDADLSKEIFIRNEGHTVQEAFMRQLCHYSYHIGQIVMIGKICLGENWKSLSIPPGKSDAFNKEKFSFPKIEADDMNEENKF